MLRQKRDDIAPKVLTLLDKVLLQIGAVIASMLVKSEGLSW